MKKLLLSTLFSILFVGVSTAQIPEDGLMGRYELDNGTYVDATSNGYDLTAIGTGALFPADDRFGEPLKALLFVNDYLSLASSPGVFDFDAENAVSLAVWMKIDQTVIDWTGILNNWGGFDMGGYYLGLTPTQQVRWNVNSDEVIDSSPVPTGIWMHIAVTFDGTFSRLYIDGTLISQVEPGVALTPSVYPFSVGAQSDNDTNKFPGTVDEVLVYNRALMEQEVIDIYNNVPLSIDDLSALSEKIKVVPNPAAAQFTVTYDPAILGTISTIRISDMKGRVLMERNMSSTDERFNVSTLPSGVYHLTFTSEFGGTYTKQLLKR